MNILLNLDKICWILNSLCSQPYIWHFFRKYLHLTFLLKKLENSELFTLFFSSDPDAVSSNGGDEYVSQRKRWYKKIWRRNVWRNNQLPDILLKSNDQTSFFKNLKIVIQFFRNIANTKFTCHCVLLNSNPDRVSVLKEETFPSQNLSNLSLE